MKKPNYVRPGAPQLSARSFNSLVENDRLGKSVVAGAGLAKKVTHGMQVIGLRPREARAYPAFVVWQISPTKIRIQAGTWYANSTGFDYAGADLTVSNGLDQVVLATLTVAGTVGVAVAIASALPAWSASTRWRVLARVSMASGAITTVSAKWPGGDIYTDDVFPRTTNDYYVPLWDATATGSGWSGQTLAGSKGPVASPVRAAAGDPP